MKIKNPLKKEETQIIKFNASSFFTAKAKHERFRIIEQAIWTTFGSLIMAFAIVYFIRPAEIISGGITGLALIIGEITNNDGAFAIWNILLNVPLFLFGFWKVGPRFALMSVLAIIMSSVFSVLLPSDVVFIDHAADVNRLIAVVAGGITIGIAFSIIYRFGASSGGTDFVATYLSTKKGISISQITLFISIGIVFVGNIIIESLNTQFDMHVFITPALIYTLIGLFTTKITSEYLFPKFKKCKIEVITCNGSNLRNHIKRSEYPHAYSYTDVTGSRHKKRHKFLIVCSHIERKRTLKMIKKADPESFVIVSRLTGLLGNFRVPEL